jgi:hypothetical protein
MYHPGNVPTGRRCIRSHDGIRPVKSPGRNNFRWIPVCYKLILYKRYFSIPPGSGAVIIGYYSILKNLQKNNRKAQNKRGKDIVSCKSFSTLISREIFSGPVMILQTQNYGDHSVAVVGYSFTSSGNYIIINDGLSTSSTKSMVFGSWAGAIAGYSRPT